MCTHTHTHIFNVLVHAAGGDSNSLCGWLTETWTQCQPTFDKVEVVKLPWHDAENGI